MPLVADGAQQGAAERAGARRRPRRRGRPGKMSAMARICARVLGVDDGGAAGHGQDVVGEQGAQREVATSAGAADNDALGRADQLVVREATLVGVEVLAGFERERVVAALGVGELHLVALAEQAAPVVGSRRHGREAEVRALRRGRQVPAKARSTSLVASTPNTRSLGVDDEVLGRRAGRASPRGGPGPSMVHGRGESGLEPPGQRADRRPTAVRSIGVAVTAASLTSAKRLVVAVDDHQRLRTCLGEPAQRLGQGGVGQARGSPGA